MKVRVFSADNDVLNAIAFGERSRSSIDRARRTMDRFGRNLSSRARDIFDRVSKRVDDMLDEDINRLARGINRKGDNLYSEDTYRYLDKTERISNARPKMRRLITAHPEIRRLIREQRIEGYNIRPDDEFINTNPEDCSVYRAVMNGVSKRVMVDDKERWLSEYEYGCTFDEDEHLYLEDQLDALATYDRICDIIDSGMDPTSSLGESLTG